MSNSYENQLISEHFTEIISQIGENIVAHLQAHKDAKVKITIDIQSDSNEGFKVCSVNDD